MQTRNRQCNTPKPQYGGVDCVGDGMKVAECNIQHCPSKLSRWRSVIFNIVPVSYLKIVKKCEL